MAFINCTKSLNSENLSTLATTKTIRKNFFADRVINVWNSLAARFLVVSMFYTYHKKRRFHRFKKNVTSMILV